MDLNKIKEDIGTHKNFFVIVADKEKGSEFHLQWDQDEFDLFNIMEYLKTKLFKKMDGEVDEPK